MLAMNAWVDRSQQHVYRPADDIVRPRLVPVPIGLRQHRRLALIHAVVDLVGPFAQCLGVSAKLPNLRRLGRAVQRSPLLSDGVRCQVGNDGVVRDHGTVVVEAPEGDLFDCCDLLLVGLGKARVHARHGAPDDARRNVGAAGGEGDHLGIGPGGIKREVRGRGQPIKVLGCGLDAGEVSYGCNAALNVLVEEALWNGGVTLLHEDLIVGVLSIIVDGLDGCTVAFDVVNFWGRCVCSGRRAVALALGMVW